LLYAAPLPLNAASAEDTAFQIRTAQDSLSKARGVAAVTVADGLPLDFRYRIKRVALLPDAKRKRDSAQPQEMNVAPKFVGAHVTRVGDGYLNTMGISLLRGRDF